MEIRHLKTFLAVAKLLSFNKAADRLNYAQSSISAQIQALEAEFGVQLFDRLGRSIVLTEAGMGLIPYAQKIIDLSDETLAEIAEGKEPAGSLNIRIPESLGIHRLAGAISEFSRRFPGVRLHLVTCAHEGLRKDLCKGVIDLGFLLTESIGAADLEVEVLGFESIVLVASPSHRLAGSRHIRTDDLRGETLLLSTVDCSYRRTFEKMLQDKGVALKVTLTFHSVETLKSCVIEGAGITILPAVSVAREIEEGVLTRLAWEEKEFDVAILMIRSKGRWVSPALKAFMDMARTVLKEA